MASINYSGIELKMLKALYDAKAERYEALKVQNDQYKMLQRKMYADYVVYGGRRQVNRGFNERDIREFYLGAMYGNDLPKMNTKQQTTKKLNIRNFV